MIDHVVHLMLALNLHYPDSANVVVSALAVDIQQWSNIGERIMLHVNRGTGNITLSYNFQLFFYCRSADSQPVWLKSNIQQKFRSQISSRYSCDAWNVWISLHQRSQHSNRNYSPMPARSWHGFTGSSNVPEHVTSHSDAFGMAWDTTQNRSVDKVG